MGKYRCPGRKGWERKCLLIMPVLAICASNTPVPSRWVVYMIDDEKKRETKPSRTLRSLCLLGCALVEPVSIMSVSIPSSDHSGMQEQLTARNTAHRKQPAFPYTSRGHYHPPSPHGKPPGDPPSRQPSSRASTKAQRPHQLGP